MLDILDKIRQPSLFILLLLLNVWLFFDMVYDDRPPLLYMLIVLFFFLSFDYQGIRHEYMRWIAVFIVITLLDFSSHKLNVLTPLVLMQCASRMNIRTYLQYNVIIMGATAILLLLTVGTGRMTMGDGIDFVRIRFDFGYGHPNLAGMYYWGFFLCLLLYCYLSKYRNLLWILIGGIFVFSLYLYSETVSRGFIIAAVLFILIFGYYSLRLRLRKDYVIGYSRYILYALPVLLTGVTLYFSLNVSRYPLLDLLLSQRLSLFGELLHSIAPLQYLTGTSAFGYITVDSSYLHLLFEAGVLLYVLFIWMYYFAIKNIIRQQNFLIITIFISFLIYGLIESLLLLPMVISNNLFWVLLYRYRYTEDHELDVKKDYTD